ncbi:uncharacterized protein [Diadema setosum]|uniref:uncharacterized protein n=1 Tax=Diadema setosum TaxID=31175 RepID=UPI003B3BDEAC
MSSSHGPETCEICGQEGFVGEAEVRTHMLLDHEENGGSCPLCDLGQVTVEELALHINTAHRSILSPYVSKESQNRGAMQTSQRCISDAPFASSDTVVVVGEEVCEGDSLIYIEDYFGESESVKHQNGNLSELGTANRTSMDCIDSVEDADVAAENGSASEVGKVASSEEGSVDVHESAGVSEASGDLFDETRSQEDSCKESAQEPKCRLVDEAREDLQERKVIRLEAGRAAPQQGDGFKECQSSKERSASQEGKQTDRKRGRKEPDVRPKDTQRPPPERRSSQQSVDTNNSLRSESGSVRSETSSPFKKLLRTLTGSAPEEEEKETKREESGIWVERLTNDSEPDIIGDDADVMIEDALAADEVEFDDIPSTSGINPSATSTPSKSHPLPQKTKGSPKKPTLLSLSMSAKNVDSPILCPLCGLGSYDPNFLSTHINNEHPEGAVGGATESVKGPGSGGADRGEEISCPVCGLSGLGPQEMNAHVERHFTDQLTDGGKEVGSRQGHSRDRISEMEKADRQLAQQLLQEERKEQRAREEEEFRKLQEKYGTDGRGSFRGQSERNTSRQVWQGQLTPFEYHAQRAELAESMATGIDSGQTRTTGIVPKLMEYYNSKVHGVSFARLSLNLDHFSSAAGDVGWGCGYRNIQMLLSAMVEDPQFRQVVFNGRKDIPSIPRIQLLIEDAWSKGFDVQGRGQLQGKVHNTRKWIGATEVVAMLSALRIRCKLYDFHAPSGPNGTHPRLFAWIRDYFGRPPLLSMDGSGRSNKLPLYLQHEGHSRTVVGCDIMKDKSTRLLIFDPSMELSNAKALRRGEITGHTLKPVRKTLGQMKAKQYQVVSIEGLMTKDQEYERSKLLSSHRIP